MRKWEGKSIKFFRIIAIILLIAWMILIFSLSAQTSTESSGTSGRVITAVLRIFYPDFDELSEAEKQAVIEPFQFIVRKGAHFTAYAVLGVFAFLSVVTYKNIKLKYRYLLSLGICLMYSISDEIHQYFVPGRSCEVRDILIDFSGAFLAISFLMLISKIKKFKKYI